ncbi:helix-turn-helix transcriptional regulator [Streptomyces sp. NPDC001985]|uniref:helix-turn-helix transcriptional regulator n=1 Tax=Streptomyces sp. NPDC001985 TaxID=3154406 RepID=UPI0033248F02
MTDSASAAGATYRYPAEPGQDPTGSLPGAGSADAGQHGGVRESCAAPHTTEPAHLAAGRRSVTDDATRALTSDAVRMNARCAWLAVLASLYTGDLSVTNAQCERLARDPRWTRSPRHHDLLMLLRARSSLFAGDVHRASEILGILLARAASAAPVSLVVAWQIEALVHLGEFESADELLLEHELTGELDEGPRDRAHLLAARGGLYLATGRFPSAIDDFTACGRMLASMNVGNPAVIPWRSKAAFGALGARRYDLALVLAEDELAAARKWCSPRALGTALHAVALARRDETSVALLEEAVQLLDLGSARTEQMQALHDLGALLVERDDPTGGRSRFRAAGEVARECRNGFWADRAEAALDRLDLPGSTQTLTRQETKVAQLARAGYSNRRIAETLFLTVRTVEFHLSNVYRKLAISGRRELVTALSAAAM